VVAAAALVLVTALAVSWAALQPVRSLHAQNAALDRLEAGGLPQAASIAEIAHKRDPLNIQPLFTLAQIETLRNNPDAAQRALEQAIDREPANPETWRRLALFRLRTLNDPAGALRAYQAAYFLDPHAARSVIDVVETSRIVKGG
jgi:predicted Zn-dependent protease